MLELNLAWFFFGGGTFLLAMAVVFKEKIQRNFQCELWRCLLGVSGLTIIFSVVPLLLYLFLEPLTANVISLVAFCLIAWRLARILSLLAAGVPVPSELCNGSKHKKRVKGKCHKNDRDESTRG